MIESLYHPSVLILQFEFGKFIFPQCIEVIFFYAILEG